MDMELDEAVHILKTPCERKVKYGHDLAMKVAKEMQDEGISVYPYPCQWTNDHWHVGSLPPLTQLERIAQAIIIRRQHDDGSPGRIGPRTTEEINGKRRMYQTDSENDVESSSRDPSHRRENRRYPRGRNKRRRDASSVSEFDQSQCI